MHQTENCLLVKYDVIYERALPDMPLHATEIRICTAYTATYMYTGASTLLS